MARIVGTCTNTWSSSPFWHVICLRSDTSYVSVQSPAYTFLWSALVYCIPFSRLLTRSYDLLWYIVLCNWLSILTVDERENCSRANTNRRYVCYIRRSVTRYIASTLACSVIESRTDYCNASSTEYPKRLLIYIQRTQNGPVRVVCESAFENYRMLALNRGSAKITSLASHPESHRIEDCDSMLQDISTKLPCVESATVHTTSNASFFKRR